MKTYSIELNGKTYPLKGLENGVKEDVVDRVRANELKTAMRQAKKGLIDGEEFIQAKSTVMAINFAHEATMNYLQTDEGKRSIYRAMLPENIPDADFETFIAEQDKTDSQISATLKLVFEEAYPKKKTGQSSQA